MSAITLYYTNFVEEEAVKKQLAAATGWSLVCDAKIIEEAATRSGIEPRRLEQAAFGPPSIFNQFTHESERAFAWLKSVVAGVLGDDNVIICGFSALLVPRISHVLRVGIFDGRPGRIQRALAAGLSEKSAERLVKQRDKGAVKLAKLLGRDPAGEEFDIRLAAAEREPAAMVQLVLEHYRRPELLATDESRRAVEDFRIAADAELALLLKGYSPAVICEHGRLTLKVNRASFNFNRLADILRGIASRVDGVTDVEVLASADANVSIIRDQDFVPPPKVLLVDDEMEFVQTLSERLVTRNYGSCPVFDGEQAISCLEHETPDVMVLDLKMPGMQGTDVLAKVKEARPEVEIIILTGHGSEEDRTTCMNLGAFAWLHKPVQIDELTKVIDEAYKKVAAAKLARAQTAAAQK